jgi:hypothetical protein
VGAPKGGNGGIRNLIPNRPGERRGGRQKGSKNKLTVERVEEEIRRIAFFDPARLFAKVGYGKAATYTLQEFAGLPPDVRAAIACFDVVIRNLPADGARATIVNVRWYNKVKALEMCARHLGWFNETVSSAELEALDKRLDAWREQNQLAPTHVTVPASPARWSRATNEDAA